MKILCVFSHPDDETFAMAGTLYLLSKAGHEIIFIETTDGGAGKVHPEFEDDVKRYGSVANLRRLELEESAKYFNVKKIHYLDYPDGTLNNNHVDTDELPDKIEKIFLEEKPEAVLTYDHTGVSWHIDHIVSSLATAKAVHRHPEIIDKLLMFTFFKNHIPRYDYNHATPYMGTHKVDISEVTDKKVYAIKLHRSQKHDWTRFLEDPRNAKALTEENYILVSDQGRNDEIFKMIHPVE